VPPPPTEEELAEVRRQEEIELQHFEERIALCAELIFDQESDLRMQLYRCEVVPDPQEKAALTPIKEKVAPKVPSINM